MTPSVRPVHIFSLSCLAALAACGGKADPPNILLITLDTLRADHLSCYGYGKETSPHLDAFAAGATRYESCRATAPWTVPTHASLFTGLHPFEHGAHSFDIEDRTDNVFPFDGATPTLAEVLRGGGYRTGALIANQGYLGPESGLARGFDDYTVERVSAPELNGKALAWIDGGDEPFFLFLNYLDTHRPYNVDGGVAGSDGGSPDPTHHPSALLDRLYAQVMVEERVPDPGLVEEIIGQYDRAIGHLDAALGRLFASLDERGLLDSTWIIITSDHGEFFGEHGLVEHSKDVYEEVLDVPLIVRAPGQELGEVLATPISSVDIPRLVLDGALPEHSPHWAALFPYALGSHSLLAENHFSRPKDLLHPSIGPRLRRVRTVLYRGPQKFIHSSDGRHELYDLDDDPFEEENLYGRHPDLDATFLTEVRALLSGPTAHPGRAPEPRELSPERLEAMRALGYVDF